MSDTALPPHLAQVITELRDPHRLVARSEEVYMVRTIELIVELHDRFTEMGYQDRADILNIWLHTTSHGLLASLNIPE